MPQASKSQQSRRELPLQTRAAQIAPSTFNAEQRTVDCVWTVGSRVKRYDYWDDTYYEEELVVTAEAVDLSRFEAGVIQVLDNHRSYGGVGSILGVCTRGWIEGNEGRATMRLSEREELAGIVADIRAGIIRSISVGYRVDRYEVIRANARTDGGALDLYRAVAWTPMEISFVTVPADASAATRADTDQHRHRQAGALHPCEFVEASPASTSQSAPSRNLLGVNVMPQGATQSTNHGNQSTEPNPEEVQRRTDINDLCRRHNVQSLAAGLIERGVSTDEARSAVLNELARRDQEAGGHHNVSPIRGDALGNEREAIVRTLAARMGARVEGSVLASLDVIGLAVRALELRGERVGAQDSRGEIMRRALHATSDFPQLLGMAVNRVLLQAYDEMPPALRAVSRLANLPNFKPRSSIRLGPASSLEKVNEHGEFKYGTMDEAANGWRLATYGRIIGITRQALINDDLGGFEQIIRKFGQAASRREADELVSLLTNNPQVDDDDLFSTDRSSLITTALGAAGLGAAVKALRAQKDLDGGLVAQEPASLVVPAALEMTARQLVATITPAQVSNVQPFQLAVVVEPRLDAVSATAWYVVAANQSAMEYGYLDGAQGVQTEERAGFEVDGLEVKARLDFGCGWVAPVGWVKSTGAGS